METDTHIHTYTHTHTHTHDMTHMENLRTEDAISKFKQGRVDFLSKQSACAKRTKSAKGQYAATRPLFLKHVQNAVQHTGVPGSVSDISNVRHFTPTICDTRPCEPRSPRERELREREQYLLVQ